MKIKFYFFIGIILCFITIKSFAQVGVDHLTGAANVSLPLYTFTWGKIAIPISLSYNSNGVRTKDVEGNAGMGWNLNAGGVIIRELRDLPDDLTANNRGLLYNTNITKIAAFGIANDNNKSTCSDETSDLNYLSSQFGNLDDTEPDIFHINVPGISCKLIFDANHEPRTIPYTDIKVTYTTDAIGINSFRIITDKGLVYDFNRTELAYRKSTSANPSAIQFFKDVYNKYSTQIGYYRKWHLSKITDDANVVTLSYKIPNFANKFSKNPYEFYLGNSTTKVTQFYIEEFGPNYVIDTIKVPYSVGNHVIFGHQVNPYTGIALCGGMSALDRSWRFDYEAARTDTTRASYTRYFLSGVKEMGISNTTGYQFVYEGLTGTYLKKHIKLPDSSSQQLDRWGYYDADPTSVLLPQEVYINTNNINLDRFRPSYNTALSADYPYFVGGRTRNPNLSVIKAGLLNKVVDIKGNETHIFYESNSYYDPQAGENVNGGGLRVNKIEEFDQMTPLKKKIINYSYLDPVTGNSSGSPISLPVFAFLRPYTGAGTTHEKWMASVVRSNENLSSESTEILYSHIKESIPGIGNKRFTFSNPAMHFNTSVAPDWSPVTINIAGCVGSGYLINEKNTYPFVHNLDLNFERGKLSKLEVFNENNQKISQTNYSYSRIGTAAYIPGLKYSLNSGITAYAKYLNIVGVSNKTVMQIDTLYDLTNASQQTSIINYGFESANHQYPTQTARNNSDGSITTVKTLYSKDYNLTIANEPKVVALKSLVAKNVNIPIENYTQITQGGSTKTIAADLITFGKFQHPITDLDMPLQTLTFMSAEGVNDFSVSNIIGGNLARDSRYIPKTDFLAYNERGALLASKPFNGKVNATLYQDNSFIPKANIFNAMPSEMVAVDFEYQWHTDLIENTSYADILDRRSGKSSFTLSGNSEPNFYFNKKTGASYYIFSIWIKAATSNNLAVTVGGNVYHLPFTASPLWKYYQMKIPVKLLSGNIQLKVKSSAAIKIDDILFYPSDATVSTQAVDHFKRLKTSETTTNGFAKYYDYDKEGRLRYIYDQDKNIVYKKSYINSDDSIKFKPGISMSFGLGIDKPLVNSPIYFTSYAGITSGDGVTYTWNFGDGTPIVTTKQDEGNVTHTYMQLGTYTVTLTKSSPYYGTAVATQTVVVENPSGVRVHSGGGINDINVFENGQWQYFSEAELNTGNVIISPTTTLIQVNAFGSYSQQNPYGYQSVRYLAYGINQTGEVSGCQPSQPRVNTNQLYVNLIGKADVTIYLSDQPCGPGGGVELKKKN